jgi:hypothetical protein
MHSYRRLKKEEPMFSSRLNKLEPECVIWLAGNYILIVNKAFGDLEIHIKSEKHMKVFEVNGNRQIIS